MSVADARGVSVLHGSTYILSDAWGDLGCDSHPEHGLFALDTRFLSQWSLMLDGQQPALLSVAQEDHTAAQFFLTRAEHSVFLAPTLSLARRRAVEDVLLEEIVLTNHAREPVRAELALTLSADFADLFEVKAGAVRERVMEVASAPGKLVLRYAREGFARETCLLYDQPAHVTLGDGQPPSGPAPAGTTAALVFSPEIEPHASWSLTLRVEPHGEDRGNHRAPRPGARSFDRMAASLRAEIDAWRVDAPTLETDWEPLRTAHARSIEDLAALRFRPDPRRQEVLPAAGLPWFMTLFGRDSLLASYQALPFLPRLAAATLRLLAELQADRVDDVRDAEPGKILHELRVGELTAFGDMPHSPYYGSVDATPLFLVLLDEYERWTGDRALVRELEPHARAALAWIDASCAAHEHGFVAYERRNKQKGLENQCWKDSWNSILFGDGRRARPPIAVCEVQGYAFDARQRCARLAAEVWEDPGLARRLAGEAEQLRLAFHERFWIEDGRYVALALDGAGDCVDARASNMGHLLWSGMLSEDVADGVVRALMDPTLFSGWGVRTMGTGEQGYNPIEYHNGTVWPHDNSIIAAGLARYGRREEAGRIAVSMLRAAASFDGRLPEVFAGYPADATRLPVEYPTSSAPQAWAAGAPLLLIRALLGLEPAGEHLACDPRLPPEIGYLALRDIPGRWGSIDVAATHRTMRFPA